MSTELMQQGRTTTVEGYVVVVETDTPFARKAVNPDGVTIGVFTGPTCHKMDAECEDGPVIKGLPCAGLNFNLGMRVRVTCEIL